MRADVPQAINPAESDASHRCSNHRDRAVAAKSQGFAHSLDGLEQSVYRSEASRPPCGRRRGGVAAAALQALDLRRAFKTMQWTSGEVFLPWQDR